MSSFNNLKYHNRKKMSISLRFGFAGVGLMGGRVVDTIARLSAPDGKQLYPGLAININQGDLDSLKHISNKLCLKSSYRAAGRNPEVGYEALAQNEDEVKRAIADLAYQSDFLWFIAGLGGGTGTGSILQLVEWASDLKAIGVEFGIIVSVPREKDGYQENKNALIVLNELNEVAAARQIPIIVVDNEILFQRYMEKRKSGSLIKEWTEDSNEEIAGLLHQINIITTHTPYGHRHFDGEEFRLVLTAGGCIQFARTVIEFKDFRDEITIRNSLQHSMHKGIASEGYRLEEAAMVGISIFVPVVHANEVYDISNVQVLENAIRSITPMSEIRWGHYIDHNSSAPKVELYSIISGLGLPARVERLPQLIKELKPGNKVKKLCLDVDFEDEQRQQAPAPAINNPFKKQEQIMSAPELPEKKIVMLGQSQVRLAAQKSSGKEVPDWLKR